MDILCRLPNGLGEQLICHEVRAGACCQKTAVFQQFHGTQVDFPIAFGGIFHGASGLGESGRVQNDDVEFLAFFFQFRQEREYVTALETYGVFQSVQFGVFRCLIHCQLGSVYTQYAFCTGNTSVQRKRACVGEAVQHLCAFTQFLDGKAVVFLV